MLCAQSFDFRSDQHQIIFPKLLPEFLTPPDCENGAILVPDRPPANSAVRSMGQT
jgi:hypothetical protein